jgi:hypothetical protein
MVSLSRDLNMTVTAEGIETGEPGGARPRAEDVPQALGLSASRLIALSLTACAGNDGPLRLRLILGFWRGPWCVNPFFHLRGSVSPGSC